MVIQKAELELSLQQEQALIKEGKLKDDNPLDTSSGFQKLCRAIRRGDLRTCQEAINEGVNINAKDEFDYTPLILASLCGHYEVVRHLLEAGALCERDTFQGERCFYNALTDRIRSLLLQYAYSKSTDPLQPFASHITSLLQQDRPQTSDIVFEAAGTSIHLHKVILSARSPYFSRKLAAGLTSSWKLPPSLSPQSFRIAIKYLYLGDIPPDVTSDSDGSFTEEQILDGIDKISKHLEIRNLWEAILGADDRRAARQRRHDEQENGRRQMETWFKQNVLQRKFVVASDKISEVQWNMTNNVYADVILRVENDLTPGADDNPRTSLYDCDQTVKSSPKLSSFTLYPTHRAMLLRSEFFQAMFSSAFLEAQQTTYLRIVALDFSPAVLEIVLHYLYCEKVDIPLHLALDVLYAADQLLIEKLKVRAATLISTMGSGAIVQIPDRLDMNSNMVLSDNHRGDEIDIFEVIRAAWRLRVPRLEEFGARYLAYRLEEYIDGTEFKSMVKESAGRIRERQEVDTIEMLDDIRFYLSERFRMRFDDVGMSEICGEESAVSTVELSQAQEPGNVIVHRHSDTPRVMGSQDEKIKRRGTAREDIGKFRTMDGTEVDDEIEGEAHNYRMLLDKIDNLLDSLELEA